MLVFPFMFMVVVFFGCMIFCGMFYIVTRDLLIWTSVYSVLHLL